MNTVARETQIVHRDDDFPQPSERFVSASADAPHLKTVIADLDRISGIDFSDEDNQLNAAERRRLARASVEASGLTVDWVFVETKINTAREGKSLIRNMIGRPGIISRIYHAIFSR